ncbi:hypothetical protein EL79_5050 [Escherichia coli]|nr:hypothetical protein EL80_5250 [Escherichia coli]KGM78752.1 hypothetical protein EL79_5050 [Escherichia coli]
MIRSQSKLTKTGNQHNRQKKTASWPETPGGVRFMVRIRER